MATRGGQPINLVWLLVNQQHARRDDLATGLRTEHAKRLGLAQLSVNAAADGMRALIKVASTESNIRGSISAAVMAATTRVFTEADHHEALAMVRAPEWVGEPGRN